MNQGAFRRSVTVNHVTAWEHATPDATSKRFLNILLRDAQLDYDLSRLFALFADPPPPMTGTYLHHNGWQR